MNLVDQADLELTLDDTEIFNDLRVMIPHYYYDLSYIDLGGGNYQSVVTWRDLIYQSLDGPSVNKYGRRTKTQKFHVMDASFQEAYCENNKQKYAEPLQKAKAKIIGSDEFKIIQCLNTRLSEQYVLDNPVMELNDTFRVDSIILEIRPNQAPVLSLGLGEVQALELENLFIIDTDLIDGGHVIG